MKKAQVMAYYFPNWHPDARNDEWHGKGWTEWDVAKHATPRFEGHKMPKVPLWGYEDESDPKVMEKKIDAAASHGVDGFIFDWYWFENGSYRIKCLDNGFLKAANKDELKFAIMWDTSAPGHLHPSLKFEEQPWRFPGEITVQAFFNATEHCIKNYFTQPNYLRKDGKLYIGFYRFDVLLKSFGGADGLKVVFDDFRRRTAAAGLGELYIDMTVENIPHWEDDPEKSNELLKKCGVDGVSTYCCPVIHREKFPEAGYPETVENGILEFEKQTKKTDLPYQVNVITSRDSSPRTVQSDIYGDYGYPYDWIINDSTPELFEKFLRAAKEFIESDKSTGDTIGIYAWNEWTEGGYLEPDTENGYAYLEAIKRVFR